MLLLLCRYYIIVLLLLQNFCSGNSPRVDKDAVGSNMQWISQQLPFSVEAKSAAMNGLGNMIILGNPEEGNGQQQGIVRVLSWNGSVWQLRGQSITGCIGFGAMVAMNDNGNVIAIRTSTAKSNSTTVKNDDNHATVTGEMVQIYGWDIKNQQWELSGNLDMSGELSSSKQSISLNGDGTTIAVVGVSSNNVTLVRILQWKSPSIWIQIGYDIHHEASSEGAIVSVALNSAGNTLIIGKSSADFTTDAVLVYKWNGVIWNQQGSNLIPKNEVSRGGLVVDISSTGDVIAFHSEIFDFSSAQRYSRVQVFAWTGTEWKQRGVDLLYIKSTYGQTLSLNAFGDKIVIGNSKQLQSFAWDGSTWVSFGRSISHSAGEIALNAAGNILVTTLPHVQIYYLTTVLNTHTTSSASFGSKSLRGASTPLLRQLT